MRPSIARPIYLIKSRLAGIMVLAILLLPLATTAQPVSSTAYNFLDVTTSARIYGLGGVNISLVDDDVTTIDQNPALLGPEMSNQVAVGYMRYLGGSNFASLRYAHSAGERGAWGASIHYFGYGSMKETDVAGNIIGTFSPLDVSFAAQYSHDIAARLRGGAQLKMVYSGYADYTAFAIATDLGINYYDEERDLSLSATVANLGGQVKRFNETYDRLPVDVRLGWSQSFGSFPVRFSVTAWGLTKWKLPFYKTGDGSLGSDNTTSTEPIYKDSFMSNLLRHLVFSADLISSRNFYIGLGYNYRMRSDMSTYHRSFLSGWSLGAGLKVKSFNLGLAFAQPHSGGTTLMVNLGLNLNDLIN